MRARVVDPRGPFWTRAVLPILGVLLMLAPLLPLDALGPGIFLWGLALAALAPFLVGRRRAREAELVLGPGCVDVKRAGWLDQRIRGRKVSGASTSHLPGGFGLSLMHEGRPVSLEVETEADADAIRAALGIGHHGFGKMEWLTRPDDADAASRAARVIVGLSALVTLLGLSMDGVKSVGFLVGMMGFFIGAFATFIALVSAAARTNMRPRIVLEPRGVVIGQPYAEILYSAITLARESDDGIAIVLESGDPVMVALESWRLGWHRGMTADERANLVAQINAAAGRTRGLGPPEPEVAFQVEELGRHGEAPRGWLARLDAVAHRLQAEGGYRGTSIPRDDLWAALENHDAPPDVRAAAARLLARADKEGDAGERIARIAASARDQATEKRIRIALEPDLEEAARELEALEDQEPLSAPERRRA